MYSRKRKIDLYSDINFAPLMDLLTSVVGTLLLVVIFAVLSARSSQIKISTPRLQEAPLTRERKVFLCTSGRVRLFDWDGGKRQLLNGLGAIKYETIPDAVARANKKNAQDGWFRYSLAYDDWASGDQIYRSISLVAEPLEGSPGENAEDLDDDASQLADTLDGMDKRRVWITFLVDKNSVDVFQKARAMVVERGIAAGWDPITEIAFPYRECIKGCPGGTDDAADIARGIQW